MNSDNMSDTIKDINNIVNSDNIPDNIKDMLEQFSKFTNSKKAEPDEPNKNNSTNSINPDLISNMINMLNNSNNNINNKSSTSNTNIDIEMIMKLKSIMDTMNSAPEDPRATLLLSLKPYLKESRKSKVDQYAKLFSMSRVMELFSKNGGENKK